MPLTCDECLLEFTALSSLNRHKNGRCKGPQIEEDETIYDKDLTDKKESDDKEIRSKLSENGGDMDYRHLAEALHERVVDFFQSSDKELKLVVRKKITYELKVE